MGHVINIVLHIYYNKVQYYKIIKYHSNNIFKQI